MTGILQLARKSFALEFVFIVSRLFQILDKVLDELFGKDAMAPDLVGLQKLKLNQLINRGHSNA